MLSRAAVACFLVGRALTAVLFGVARDLEADRARAGFEQRTGIPIAAVSRAFADAVSDLRSLNLLFAASGGQVSRDVRLRPRAGPHLQPSGAGG